MLQMYIYQIHWDHIHVQQYLFNNINMILETKVKL